MGADRHRSLLDAPAGDELVIPRGPTLAHVAAVVARTAADSPDRDVVDGYHHAVVLPYQVTHVGELDAAGRWHLVRCRHVRGETVPATVHLGDGGELTPTHPDMPSWRLCLACAYETIEDPRLGPLHTIGQLALVDELSDPPDGLDRLPPQRRLAVVHRRVEAVGRAAREGLFFEHIEPEHTRGTEARLVASLDRLVGACRDAGTVAALDDWLADIHRTRQEILLSSRDDELRRDFPDGSWVVLSGYLPWADPTVTLALLVHTVAVSGDGTRACVLPASALWCARARHGVPFSEAGGLDDVAVAGPAVDGEDVAALLPTVLALTRDGMDPRRALEAARLLAP